MEASGGDAILRVPCFKILGIFSSQIFMSIKWGWHYFWGFAVSRVYCIWRNYCNECKFPDIHTEAIL